MKKLLSSLNEAIIQGFPELNLSQGIDAYLINLNFINDDNDLKKYKEFLKNNVDGVLDELHKYILLRGEVQSGKTNNLIYLIDKAFNEGYVATLYMTGTTNDLNDQNHSRLAQAINVIRSDVETSDIRSSKLPAAHITRQVELGKKFLYSTIKKKNSLTEFIQVFKDIKGKKMIIFDEGDNTNLSDSFSNATSLAKNFDFKIIDITATPYKNLYFNQNKYDFFRNFKSQSSYMGIRHFIHKYRVGEDGDMTKYLNKDVLDFLTNENIADDFLVNTYHSNNKHKVMKDDIKNLIVNLSHPKDQLKKSISKAIENNLSIDDNLKLINNFQIANVQMLNSKTDVKPNDIGKRILIGKFKMNRGVTFETMSSQFIWNESQTYNPASIMQESRWFGYRKNEPRVTMNKRLKEAYKEVIRLEEIMDRFTLEQNFKELYDEQCFELLSLNEGNKRDE